ncbi:TIGR03084 family metal-binding protein [Actinocorallia longicatena]|uniref:TIGR03084 family metal-binding protein n=1 Tax=Actinocorallia longicatena TaxID=111803 RepID=A0ABP6Q893_9ACTN
MTATAVYDDLLAECADLDALVSGLTPSGWALPTPADGWTIAHQIAHLSWTDRHAALAATDPEAFTRLIAETTDPMAMVAAGADPAAHPHGPLEPWRRSREEVVDALRALPPGARIPWFGPPMAGPSMATARLMETWAHGQDVADALRTTREPTHRLRHVAHIAVRARDYAHHVNGTPPPAIPIRVELTAPTGETWTWGPGDAPEKITGLALDFCLLAVRRRHPDDLDLHATGPAAAHWLTIAQAFAGPPGPGRRPGQDTAHAPSTH